MKVEFLKVTNFDTALRGMRNPKDSWSKSDTIYLLLPHHLDVEKYDEYLKAYTIDNLYSPNTGTIGYLTYNYSVDNEKRELLFNPYFRKYAIESKEFGTEGKVYLNVDTDEIALIGKNDLDLCMRLCAGGPVHSKFARMITVSFDIIAPFDFLKEMDTYKVATVCNSCSTMHKITSKKIDISMFSTSGLRDKDIEQLKKYIDYLNEVRDDESLSDIEKTRIMSKLNALGFEQRRTYMMNYETLNNIYKWRYNHKLFEWRWFSNDVIANLPYFKDLFIINKYKNQNNKEK